jgi:Fic family protein
LRKTLNIRTVRASLAIEGNSLSSEQVTDILNGVVVAAPQKDITEVKNAVSVYEKFDDFDPFRLDDLLSAHRIMMYSLIRDAGDFRNANAGIYKGKEMIHTGVPHGNVSGLMADLFSYLREFEESLLIKSCVFHYELEFIHPFSDGNGRMGRLWQQLILSHYHPLFKTVCVEELLEQHRKEYYEALHVSDERGSSEHFAEFMLEVILKTLENQPIQTGDGNRFAERMNYGRRILKHSFGRKEYMALFPNISTATAGRDLERGVEEGVLKRNGRKNQTVYEFNK